MTLAGLLRWTDICAKSVGLKGHVHLHCACAPFFCILASKLSGHVAGATGAGAFAAAWITREISEAPSDGDKSFPRQADSEDDTVLINWSSTHECRPKRFYQPETLHEVEQLVASAHRSGVLRDSRQKVAHQGDPGLFAVRQTS